MQKSDVKNAIDCKVKKVFEWLQQKYDRPIDKLDYIVTGILLVICFFSFCHGDIVVTGNRGFLYHTNFLDFYDACYEWTNDLGANYLPSTFILFAIWNLPLRLLGRVPADVLFNSSINTMWFKLLPVIIFFLASMVVYKIALTAGMGETKAKLCKYAFLVSPVAVFCQFIFSQYDIFTIVFILLGFYYYLKGDRKKFILFFGIAATFKYQALVYFVILLALVEKRIIRIITDTVLTLIPLVIEMALYYPSEGFRNSVLGFGALSYVNGGLSLGGREQVSPFLMACIALLVAAYLTKTDDTTEGIFRWAIFFLNGVSAAFFALVPFHPQWFLLVVPFWVLGMMCSRHSRFLAILQSLFILVFYTYVVNVWVGGVDQYLFKWTALKYIMPPFFNLTMQNIFCYTNYTFLFSIICMILGVFFVISHPKYQLKELDQVPQGTRGNIRLAFMVGTLAWIIPAYVCLIVTLVSN